MGGLHIGTYLSMGDDFDSRDRFLKQRADGAYEGCIIGGSGEAWSVKAALVDVNIRIGIQFKMGDLNLVVQEQPSAAPVTPSGTTAFVSSE